MRAFFGYRETAVSKFGTELWREPAGTEKDVFWVDFYYLL